MKIKFWGVRGSMKRWKAFFQMQLFKSERMEEKPEI